MFNINLTYMSLSLTLIINIIAIEHFVLLIIVQLIYY